MDIPILYQDQSLLIINKPAGYVVNKAESVKAPTIQDWVAQYIFPSDTPPDEHVREFTSRNGIVHRIDKETSGILIIAKNPLVFTALQEAFAERRVTKTYRALVHGSIPLDSGNIIAPVGRLPWNRERFGVTIGGKEASTTYQVIGRYHVNSGERFTYLSVSPITGRTHQIRVHLKYLGFPIVGDHFYAGRKQHRSDKTISPRLFLHAFSIVFQHPVSGNMLTVEAPLPEDLTQVLTALLRDTTKP